MKRLLVIVIIGLFSSLPLFSIHLQTKGQARSIDLTCAKKEAILVARGKMMKEAKKIYVFWADKAFPGSNYPFYTIAGKVASKSLPTIIKERVKYSRKQKLYTVTITLTFSESNDEAAERFIDNIQKEIPPKDLSKLSYNRDSAIKVMKKILSRW